jgi:hypothetical protein
MKILRQRLHARQNTPGTFSSFRPKKSFTCVLAIRMAMPLVKPMTMGRGMYFTAEPMPVSPMIDQNDSGHHGAHEQAIDAMSGDNPGDDDDKSSGRAADLGGRTAQSGNQKPGDDGAVNSGLRRQSRSDRKSHGQRQGHQILR